MSSNVDEEVTDGTQRILHQILRLRRAIGMIQTPILGPEEEAKPEVETSIEDADLAALVDRMGSPRVLVVGDIILDRYTWGDAERVSPEAPVLVLRSERTEHRLGGAAAVATMLRALGARASLVGLLGDDPDGECSRRLLAEAGIEHDAVTRQAGRATTSKERLMGRAQDRQPHQILRVDRGSREPIPATVEAEFARRLPALIADHDIVLVSDYAKGVCRPALLGELLALARSAGKSVLVDPARGGDFARYRGASCLTPNRAEAQEAVGMPIDRPEDAIGVGLELCRRFDLAAAVVTLDRDGMALAYPNGEGSIHPTRPRRVCDVAGAGDLVLAVLGACLAGGATLEQATRLANLAGGLEVERVGVEPITRAEILAELDPARRAGDGKVLLLPALSTVIEARRRLGHRIVLTNGCFDLIHPGHLRLLEEAAAMGDCLVVAINADASVRRLKGAGRPILDQRGRAAMLAGLQPVAYVTIFDEDTPLDLIRTIRPDVLVKGGDYAPGEIVGRDIVEGYGGTVAVARLVEGWSTTELVGRIRGAATPGPRSDREGQ